MINRIHKLKTDAARKAVQAIEMPEGEILRIIEEEASAVKCRVTKGEKGQFFSNFIPKGCTKKGIFVYVPISMEAAKPKPEPKKKAKKLDK
jgi:hypothetical protein